MLNFKHLQKLFFKLSGPLLIKLPQPPDKQNLKSVIQYYSSFAVIADFFLVSTTQKKVLKIMQDIKSSKVDGVYKLSGSFLKMLLTF